MMDSIVLFTYGGILAILFLMLFGQIHRYRNVSNYQEKEQTKWVFYGFLIIIGLFTVASGPWEYVRALPAGSVMPWWVPLVEACWILAVFVTPVTLTISILRYRLYDIDIIINRTLVYGALTSFIVTFYVLVVAGMGILFQSRGNLVLSLIATALVAVIFQPLRQWLQNGVNRLLYGQREEPFAVLGKLGQRIENSGLPEELLDVIVETLTQTLKLPYAEIRLKQDDESEVIITSGTSSSNLEAFPVHYQGYEIGSLNVPLRSPAEPFSESDRRLLNQIAFQTGPIAHAVQLARALKKSRARIVETREHERRRLYRDLHDGLGPVLASQGLKVAAVRYLLDSDSERAKQILDEMASQNESAVAEVRRLVYALRPPELDDLGLVKAVREYVAGLTIAGQTGTTFRVTVQDFEEFSQEIPSVVEVSAYRIVTEALTNVTRHAKAKECQVKFSLEGSHYGEVLRLEVLDDGVGFSKPHEVGVGLNSMRERAEEIGGRFSVASDPSAGTRVIVRLPLTG
jgi:signal transduction histidine kinase